MSESTESTEMQVTDLVEESISTTIEETITSETTELVTETTELEAPEVEAEITSGPLKDLMFDGIPVTIDVPDDVRQLADSKGFDAEKLISELFTSETFEFSEETRTALDAAYGKTYVDFLLKGLKADMANSVGAYKDGIAAKEKAETDAYENVLSIVGGEEGWAKLEDFANAQGTDFVDGLNEAMKSGNRWLQEMAINHAVALMNPAQAEVEAVKPLELIQGDGAVNASKSHCSAVEYREAIANGDYNKEPAKWDALRRAGMAKGL
ncbi:MAG: hypothetical protein ACRCTP_04875 [Aeromonas popoffii]|uniref:hypothetical protein n=1 Tax=Aeromonas popoffii TaxID=70856 RepID=UPI003F3C484E